MRNTIPCRLLLILLIALLGSTQGWAQSRTISGTVRSSEDGTVLSGVSVLVKGSSTGTQTDENGVFRLNAVPNAVLVFSSLGFETLEIKTGNQLSFTISLTPANQKMDEVVVVGYGTIKRSKVTSSISKLDNKVLETGIRSNPAQALAGTIPGLRVSTGTGRPGALPTIVLRGGTGFDGSGSPLIIMDGQVRSSLSDINPEEIESLEVLKDASSTAIYGARASNGVILITSKKGKAGKASISLKARTGWNYLNVPYNFLSAQDYITWQRRGVVEAIKNGTLAPSVLAAVGPRGTGNLYKDANGNVLDGNYDSRAVWSTMRLTDANRELLSLGQGWKTMTDAVPTNSAGAYDPNGTFAELLYKDFSYGDYGLNKSALVQDYNIGMTGGNDRGKYYANIGYYDEGGLSLATFYKRLNLALNGEYKIKDWLKSESSVQFIKANWRDQSLQNGEANYWGRMLSAPPTMRGTNMNGELLLGRDASDGNPVINIDKYHRKNQTDKLTLGQAFTVNFHKDLYAKIGGIMMYDEGLYEAFNRDFRTGLLSYTNPNTGWNRTRSSSNSFNRTTRQTYNAILNYTSSFSDMHNLGAMAGFEYYTVYNTGFSAGGALAPTDDFQDLGLTLNNATTQTRNMGSFHSRERIMSGFGRINYDYDGKYLATFTVRRDGYSRLIGDNQYGTFPGLSVGWMAHRENFLASTEKWLSYLKLRASWGKNGNIGIGTNEGIGLYELQGSYGAQDAYNGVIGFLQTGITNPQLTWEKSNTVEVGADMAFLNNKINASISYYNRLTTDKLAFINLPVSSGLSSLRTNNGSMRNKGVEMELSYRLIKGKNFRWTIGANAAWNKNIIVKLPSNGNENNRQGGTQIYDPKTGRIIWVGGYQEGQEYGEIFGYVSAGIIRTQKDLDAYNVIDIAAGEAQYGSAAGKRVASQALISQLGLTNHISTKLGDMMWKDLDKNDTIDYRDRVSLGRIIPRWTGGLNTTVSYKGLSLFARVDFGAGHIQQDFMQMWALGSFQGEFNATDIVKDTWTPENPNAKYPRYTWADQLNTKNFDRPSDMFWVNSSYLAFREVSLSYTVPKGILQRFNVEGLTLTVTGQNLGYISNKMLNLPERTGSQNSAYTIPTSLVFGANLTF
ncbi:TonB-dependent receptor [Flavihumibacter cheonanensis]|uniref:SusC/RagA family TonB-linked outer membrane protein n=1 Tax=Flavihumibacter cheonanensis TaxID=1442385 RepID=UPI001EF7DA01|nr:SusC/RagA family TonB-linked outer membrane protein [Flavihumibacter cheonanensis]MCG7751490.1 SusC/RagA family TonB-linked outer membrane protein [Flavihumibacter cheonanensis]